MEKKNQSFEKCIDRKNKTEKIYWENSTFIKKKNLSSNIKKIVGEYVEEKNQICVEKKNQKKKLNPKKYLSNWYFQKK